MSNIAFPATLNHIVSDSYNITHEPAATYSKFLGIAVVPRRLVDRPNRLISLVLETDEAGIATFNTFYNTTVRQSELSFMMPLFLGQATTNTIEVRIINSPRVQMATDKAFTIALVLKEVLS